MLWSKVDVIMLLTIWEEAGYTTPLLLAFIILIKENDDLQTRKRRTSIPARLKENILHKVWQLYQTSLNQGQHYQVVMLLDLWDSPAVFHA